MSYFTFGCFRSISPTSCGIVFCKLDIKSVIAFDQQRIELYGIRFFVIENKRSFCKNRNRIPEDCPSCNDPISRVLNEATIFFFNHKLILSLLAIVVEIERNDVFDGRRKVFAFKKGEKKQVLQAGLCHIVTIEQDGLPPVDCVFRDITKWFLPAEYSSNFESALEGGAAAWYNIPKEKLNRMCVFSRIFQAEMQEI